MKRFFPNGNNDDGGGFSHNDGDDEDDDVDFDYDEMDAMILDNSVEMMHLGLVEQQFRQTLLDRAMKLAKQDWFWAFRNTTTRMKRVEKIYKRLALLLSDPK